MNVKVRKDAAKNLMAYTLATKFKVVAEGQSQKKKKKKEGYVDRETRTNQAKVRKQKAEADRHIWNKVPPKIIKRSEVGHARRSTPQRIIVKED